MRRQGIKILSLRKLSGRVGRWKIRILGLGDKGVILVWDWGRKG